VPHDINPAPSKKKEKKKNVALFESPTRPEKGEEKERIFAGANLTISIHTEEEKRGKGQLQ